MQVERQPVSATRPLNLLLILTLFGVVPFAMFVWRQYLDTAGYTYVPGQPFGGDFFNQWSAARLLLADAVQAIYRHQDFTAFQQAFIGSPAGLRLWAYPVHSLLFVWPFGLLGYYAALVAWTALGLAVLAWGARRFGFNWTETAVLALSPAALSCIWTGQSGNVACGLLLAALSGGSTRSAGPVLSAAILTVKPQTGVLLPVLWLAERRWFLIAATTIASLALVGLSALVFGLQPWRDYFGDSLPALSDLELHGEGVFRYMMPSLFMSLRLLGVAGETAFSLHAAFAVAVMAVVAWRLTRTDGPWRKAAVVLTATCLVTPYLHLYDLTLLMAAGLILVRVADGLEGRQRMAMLAAAFSAWVLPWLSFPLAVLGVPVSPLIIVAILAVALTPVAGLELESKPCDHKRGKP